MPRGLWEKEGAFEFPYPQIAQAIPSLRSGLAPAVESLLQTAPALAGGLTVATWVIWGLGELLGLLGVGLHLVVAMWRRRGGGAGPQPGRPVAV